MASDELLPCPFCGAEAKPVFHGSCNYVTCSNEEDCWCGMTCPTRTPEEAVRIWNRRTIGRPTCEYMPIGDERFGCSECGNTVRLDFDVPVTDETPMPFKYCPNCGSMVTEKEEDE